MLRNINSFSILSLSMDMPPRRLASFHFRKNILPSRERTSMSFLQRATFAKQRRKFFPPCEHSMGKISRSSTPNIFRMWGWEGRSTTDSSVRQHNSLLNSYPAYFVFLCMSCLVASEQGDPG